MELDAMPDFDPRREEQTRKIMAERMKIRAAKKNGSVEQSSAYFSESEYHAGKKPNVGQPISAQIVSEMKLIVNQKLLNDRELMEAMENAQSRLKEGWMAHTGQLGMHAAMMDGASVAAML
jgi:hypothetical protein